MDEERKVTRFAPSVLLTDDYWNQFTYTPPAWMWVLAFAIRGVPWAVEMVESGVFDRAMLEGAYI
jgi:hypothetical protein